MLNQQNPTIAIIDSGIGGISILRQLIKRYKAGNYLYFADNLFMPYGNKTKVWLNKRIDSIIKELQNKGVWIYALEAGNKKIYEADFTYPTALVVGSEGKGVSKLTKEKCDGIVSLKMKGSVNSLNASVAAGIILFEIVRQRS